RRAFRAVVENFSGAPRRVSVALLGDPSMERLHVEFLSEPGTTDVLSFDLRDARGRAAPGVPFEAEIAIGIRVAEREARKRRHPPQREVDLYLIHGLLHLAGFDDHDPKDRARMRRAERRALSLAGWLETGSSG